MAQPQYDARAMRWRMLAIITPVNLSGAVLVFIYYRWVDHHALHQSRMLNAGELIYFVVAFAALAFLGYRLNVRWSAPVRDSLAAGGELSDRARPGPLGCDVDNPGDGHRVRRGGVRAGVGADGLLRLQQRGGPAAHAGGRDGRGRARPPRRPLPGRLHRRDRARDGGLQPHAARAAGARADARDLRQVREPGDP